MKNPLLQPETESFGITLKLSGAGGVRLERVVRLVDGDAISLRHKLPCQEPQ